MSKRIRCAIYTRKSTEEGLDQEFNSLDAQREACEAFIQSQRGLGWIAQKKRYDDGGISGGTMDRPALQTLLTDIEKGKVDLVVVYKVDRLTRSLMDFAKIIETFDARGISFVSVTQQFNTANSMGRLTLNVLLSFAQFEREVTAERIRDKIAASKKKGMWMGGLPPLGYDVKNKKLVVNKAEAATVKTLFRLYMEQGSVPKVFAEVNRLGMVTKKRCYRGRATGGKPFTRGHLYQLFRNPIYAGEVRHKGNRYPGQHEAIIDPALWNAVQGSMDEQAPARRSPSNVKQSAFLTGLIYDETGDRLSPTYAKKGERSYRYYISKRLIHHPGADSTAWRLPAQELEKTIIQAIVNFLTDESEWMKAVDISGLTPDGFKQVRKHVARTLTQLRASDASSRKQAIHEILYRVAIQPGTITVVFKRDGLDPTIEASAALPGYELAVPFHTKRRGVEQKIIIGGEGSTFVIPDQNLIAVVRRSHEWHRLLTEESDWSIQKLAKHASIDASDVTRFLPLAFLAPEIVEAILDGRQPIDLNVERLKKVSPIPADWIAQRRQLGFVG
ncbi:MAG: recombinase family protein [Proteobacteria bacterium]|nr:recombinase family protein [Pseudomonadota bacterium]